MNIKWNAAEFELEEKADVIFSNAVFHWIDADRQEKLAANLAAQLKPGGELVCEFGGNDIDMTKFVPQEIAGDIIQRIKGKDE